MFPTKEYERTRTEVLIDLYQKTVAFESPHRDQGGREATAESGRYSCLMSPGWVNVYRCFTDSLVWPRGFTLSAIRSSFEQDLRSPGMTEAICPIQQGLSDGDPDVDAIYRLLLPLPLSFRSGSVALGAGCWCPFNSQNTVFFRRAFPLLYLPSSVHFA